MTLQNVYKLFIIHLFMGKDLRANSCVLPVWFLPCVSADVALKGPLLCKASFACVALPWFKPLMRQHVTLQV